MAHYLNLQIFIVIYISADFFSVVIIYKKKCRIKKFIKKIPFKNNQYKKLCYKKVRLKKKSQQKSFIKNYYKNRVKKKITDPPEHVDGTTLHLAICSDLPEQVDGTTLHLAAHSISCLVESVTILNMRHSAITIHGFNPNHHGPF